MVYINGYLVNKMLVDTGAVVNIMPYSALHRLGRSTRDLIKTNITLSDFNGQTSEAQGVLSVDLTVGSKTVPTSFFIVHSKSTYNVLLGRGLDPCQLLHPFHTASMSNSVGWR
jgi:hypothetical protein